MSSASASVIDSLAENEVKVRRASRADDPLVFTNIYDHETNMVIWERQLPQSLKDEVDSFLKVKSSFKVAMTVTPESVRASLSDSFGKLRATELCENIAELVEMFCCLFELKRAGLRLTALDREMCPKFHVDSVPCRLLTTFQGAATEWLPHEAVHREKLGVGSLGKSDKQSGLYNDPSKIQQLNVGDVALLKGERWEGNENAGLVHRSPALLAGECRLLLTLDFSD